MFTTYYTGQEFGQDKPGIVCLLHNVWANSWKIQRLKMTWELDADVILRLLSSQSASGSRLLTGTLAGAVGQNTYNLRNLTTWLPGPKGSIPK